MYFINNSIVDYILLLVALNPEELPSDLRHPSDRGCPTGDVCFCLWPQGKITGQEGPKNNHHRNKDLINISVPGTEVSTFHLFFFI